VNLASWFGFREKPCGLVLLYHRVAPAGLDPQLLAVRPETFDAQLAAIREFGEPMTLPALLAAVETGALRRPGVAITFDDGYVDNLRYATPVLERHGFPATVFVCTAPVTEQVEYWWDSVERAILHAAGPATLALDLPGGKREWRLDGRPEDFPQWNVLDAHDPTPRHRAYRELMTLLKPVPPPQRAQLIGALLTQLGLSSRPEEAQRAMTAAELRTLAASPVVEIGAHTNTHARLSSLTRAQIDTEVAGSKAALQELTGRPIRTFAYPYGGRDDYNGEAIEAVRDAGFDLACSNFPGALRRGVDRWQLPRHIVRDVPAEMLRADLQRAAAAQ
jgi:peptidoglycan/xylan/chitin deacetylase (PgdA/CDA1 family)